MAVTRFLFRNWLLNKCTCTASEKLELTQEPLLILEQPEQNI